MEAFKMILKDHDNNAVAPGPEALAYNDHGTVLAYVSGT